MMPHPVGVVGASARAAVHSLARAGLSAWAVDLFGDRDLTSMAPCAVCSFADYPTALPRLAEHFPPGPVLYTGGLENHPNIVAELAAERELWGNPPNVLERVRDPWGLHSTLAAAGVAVPRLVPHREPCPSIGRWLRKPLRSSAGLGIRFAEPGEAASELHDFQQWIDGTPLSAVFRDATLFGVTEPLVGLSWLHARPFAYCGSVTLPDPTDELTRTLARLGSALAREFGLRGVWNVDFILKDGVPYPVEVNPRYSASVEVLEHATEQAVFGNRLAATRSEARRTIAKAIYFAPHALTFPTAGPWDADLAGTFDPCRLPAFADIPAAGSAIPAGFPVITLFASGSSSAACRERLQSQAGELDQLFAKAAS
jgi:predicted ATP-grasp superfamily ATP-dependent carboligase